ncbi:ATP-binding protein [Delftia sp. HK171]|uniref:ATP-binding protein n=1 Tax=Delftia sp. HK171 TaxID=1920191 RepID=UPI0009031053|nr:ATP-binding protein [Delftia sp. HK171]
MTLLEPTLMVSRLVVFQGAHVAFDCKFKSGVNIIRGRNSSGKTTIMDMLAFGLGAENIRWKKGALQCTSTCVEVLLNGKTACLKRDIGVTTQRPMAIFWGSYEESLKAGFLKWEHYPFKRSANCISFSQALFAALDLPQAQGAGSSNLTMHQILRVLYADQPSVHSPIFRLDSFDSPLNREMIGGYLSGVYDDTLHDAQIRLREVQAHISKRESELKSIFGVLGRSGQTPDLEFLNERTVELESARNALIDKIAKIKLERSVPTDLSSVANINNLRSQLNDAKHEESKTKDQISALELELKDSNQFIKELESRLQSLDESKETRNYFGKLSFVFCPCCLNKLPSPEENNNICHLCTGDIGDEAEKNQLLRMKNEIAVQLNESRILKNIREEEISKLRTDLPHLSQRIRSLEQDYSSVANVWSTDVETAIEASSRELGSLDREIIQAYEQQKLAAVITDLQKQRDEFRNEESKLEDSILLLERQQESRKKEVAEAVSKVMVRLLGMDLPLTPEFINAEFATFDFVENSVYVNGVRNFSESSAVVLRHIFHLAFLTVSTEKEFMRLPRFMMLDGIDDGGMEVERSHRLQKIIVDECSTYQVDYQLIFATSEINSDLEATDLVVGRYFTPENRSLDVLEM